MGCCGASITIAKAGQVPLTLPTFDGDYVSLVYQLPGIQIPIPGPVTRKRYKATTGVPIAVDAKDAAIMLQQYNPIRRVQVWVEAEPTKEDVTVEGDESSTGEDKADSSPSTESTVGKASSTEDAPKSSGRTRRTKKNARSDSTKK